MIMRHELQLDGRTGSLFIVSRTLLPEPFDLTRYEKRTGISGLICYNCGASMTVYHFCHDDKAALYVVHIPAAEGEVLIASAVAYDPDTPNEMLAEFMDDTGLREDSSDAPERILDTYHDAIGFIMQGKIKEIETSREAEAI